MMGQREITIERNGKQYGGTYSIENGMLHVRTHTETRSLEIGSEDPEALTRQVLNEIVDSQARR